MAIVLGWQFGVTWLYKKQGWQMPGQQSQQNAASTQPAAGTPTTQFAGTATSPTTGPGAVEATAPGTGGLRLVAETSQPQPAVLGSGAERDPNYALQLTLDPVGAGVKSVVLNDFKSADRKKLYTFQEPYAGFVPQSRPLGTRWVSVNGQTFDLSNVTWKLLDDDDPNAATYAVDFADGSGPVARLTKTFRVFPRDNKERPGSLGFEVSAEYGVRNLSSGELKVKTAFNGPTLPPGEIQRGPDRQVISGYEEDQRVRVAAHIVEEFKPDDATKDLTKNKDGRPVLWSGTSSVYFEGIVLPGTGPAPFVQAIRAEGLDVRKETEPVDRTIATVFETSELTVPAGGQLTLPLHTYFGPRWRKVLNTDYYTPFPRSYNQTLVIVSGYCAVCTFQWLIDLLVRMLGMFHFVTRDWGLAIICLVVLVRALLHPVTKRSQISMMKMGKMGPEMERLRKKYGDNKEELSKAMWEFQKSQGVTPILGCLPMFLQMPIWIALWSALQSTFELRQAPFLYYFGVHWTWIHDLAKPDGLITWSAIHLPFGMHLSSLNVLPILMGVVFYLQQKMTPKPPAMTPEQEQQQKMMQWMTLLFPLFLYNGPSGLNLYILTSTTIGIIESKRIRDHIKQREEAEKAGHVIVDARPTRGSKQKDRDRREPPQEPKKKGLFGFLAELQARAEEMRRQAERKGGK